MVLYARRLVRYLNERNDSKERKKNVNNLAFLSQPFCRRLATDLSRQTKSSLSFLWHELLWTELFCEIYIFVSWRSRQNRQFYRDTWIQHWQGWIINVYSIHSNTCSLYNFTNDFLRNWICAEESQSSPCSGYSIKFWRSRYRFFRGRLVVLIRYVSEIFR